MIELIKERVAQEIANPRLGVLTQYLSVLKLLKEGEKPKIDWIEQIDIDEYVVYLPIDSERFYLRLTVVVGKDVKVVESLIQSGSRVYIRATSKSELEKVFPGYEKLNPTRSWSIGSPWIINGKVLRRRHDDSGIDIEPESSLHTPVVSKITGLLTLLQSDQYIECLSSATSLSIKIVLYCYISNGSLDFLSLSEDIITTACKLGVSIDFDVYVSGSPILDT